MGPEHQLHLLSTNSNLLRSLGGLAPILDNLSNVAQVHSALQSVCQGDLGLLAITDACYLPGLARAARV